MQNKTKIIALMSIYAALYAALVIFLPGLSYGPLQVRIADCLIAAVPLLGFAGVLGHTLGVFIANIPSPFIPFDLLNTIPSFIMSFVVYYTYKKTNNNYTIIATCSAYSVVLGITVGYMLSYFGAPLLETIMYITIGNIIASVLLGWPLFKLLKKIGIQHWIGKETKNIEVKQDE
ncbi:MAG: QueT transporter family protein [Candidatus Bathyarchaeota archaeon]|nr:QueT transporter family protein [Candidatus Termiticorpusculum sp.]